MSDWFKWDDPTPEERERDRRIDAINNAGSKALALVRQIEDEARQHADVMPAAIGELRKLNTVLGATINSLNRRDIDNAMQRHKEHA